MAVRFDASGDSLSRTTGLPSFPISISAWCKVNVDGDQFHGLAAIGNATLESQILADFTSTNARVHCYNGVSVSGAAASLAVGTWFHLGIVQQDPDAAADDLLIYLNGALDITAVDTHDDIAPITKLTFGNNKDSDFLNGCIAAVKVWSGVGLTAAEFAAERWQYAPLRLANLNAWNPLLTHTDLLDYSASGNSLTAGGTLTTEEGPPIPWRRSKSRLVFPASAAPPPATSFPPSSSARRVYTRLLAS
jgi:hypothetical protein